MDDLDGKCVENILRTSRTAWRSVVSLMLHHFMVSRRGLRGTGRPGRPGAAARRRLASRDVAVMRRGRDDSMGEPKQTNSTQHMVSLKMSLKMLFLFHHELGHWVPMIFWDIISCVYIRYTANKYGLVVFWTAGTMIPKNYPSRQIGSAASHQAGFTSEQGWCPAPGGSELTNLDWLARGNPPKVINTLLLC
jgi:hypothetical protein